MPAVGSAVPTGYADARPLQLRIVAAATELTTSAGWSSVTMGRLAEAVGVSRQTVYNEVGSKPALAERMVQHELSRFLEVVEAAFDDHPDDLATAIEGSTRAVLEHARGNALLHAVVSATHGADTELLPLLTTHAGSLLGTAKGVVRRRIEPFGLPFTERQVEAVIDLVVRTVLSHVMEPSGAPEETAEDVAWMIGRVLRP